MDKDRSSSKSYESRYLELVSGRRRGLTASLARSSLKLASWGFALGAGLRSRAYDHGLKAVHKASIPVISVGNLTTGGTGKTPMVIWLAEQCQARGYRPAVLSRGYHAKPGELNDEGRLITERLEGVKVFQQPDRVASAKAAAEEGFDLAILDDGFQHRRLHRDVDLVLVDATNPFGYGQLLPRGLLREPLTALRRADAVLITRTERVEASRLASIRAELGNYLERDRVWTVEFTPAALRDLSGGPGRELSWLRGRPIAAACGIGNPESFRGLLGEELGAQVKRFEAFPDHYHYQPEDLASLLAEPDSEALVVTEKDAVKLTGSLAEASRPVLALAIAPHIKDSEALLDHVAGLLPGADREPTPG